MKASKETFERCYVFIILVVVMVLKIYSYVKTCHMYTLCNSVH